MEEAKPGTPDPDPPAPVTPWGIVAQFFVIPLVIVAICAGLFAGIRWLTAGASSPRDLLGEIRTGGKTQRYQAAYQLALLMGSDPKALEAIRSEPGNVEVLRKVFRESRGEEPEVRRYMAAVLLVLHDSKTAPDLVEALADPDPETRCYVTAALGKIGDASAAGPVRERLTKDEDQRVRAFAAFALGLLEDAEAPAALRAALDDAADEVRWNAAMALASRGDAAGLGVLEKMLDRSYLKGVRVPGTVHVTYFLGDRDEPQGEMSDARCESTILSALKAIEKLGAKETAASLDRLAKDDPSPKVRAEAERMRGGRR